MAYGYGFETTPLHTLALYNAVANEGVMIKPVFVKSVNRADHQQETFETEVLNPSICSDKTQRFFRTKPQKPAFVNESKW